VNLVFGSTSPADFARAQEWVEQRYGLELRAIETPHADVLLGVTATNDLVSVASNDAATVVAIGATHGPYPGGADLAGGSLADWILQRSRQDSEPTRDLQGQYAVVLAGRDSTTLWTDDAGMRTWFWRSDHSARAFSSNLRLLAASAAAVAVDRSYEDFFLVHGFHPGHATIYQGMAAQPSGSSLVLTEPTPTPVPVPATSSSSSQIPDSEAEAIDLLYDEFLAAIETQSLPGANAGVLLGGFDSALVAAGLVRLGRDVQTFSFGYEDESYNQPYVEALAQDLGIKHHWVRVDRQQIVDGLATFSDGFNRPTNWPNYVISTAKACEAMVAAGVEQAFSGDGCDSVFLGYPGTYRRARVVKWFSKVPGGVHRVLVRVLARPWLERRLGHPFRVLLGLLRAQARSEAGRTYLSFRILDEVSLQQLRRDGAPPGARDVDEVAEELAAPHAGLPRYRLAYAGKGAVSPNKNKMIGSSDLTGLTIWSPYMHRSLKSLAAALPEGMMRPEGKTGSEVTGKYILQRMAVVKGLLPAEVVYQPKVAAVDAPVDDWYAGELLPALEEKWRSLPFDVDLDYARSLVRPKLAERLFRRYVMIDKVISHAASLLATYGAFAEAATTDD